MAHKVLYVVRTLPTQEDVAGTQGELLQDARNVTPMSSPGETIIRIRDSTQRACIDRLLGARGHSAINRASKGSISDYLVHHLRDIPLIVLNQAYSKTVYRPVSLLCAVNPVRSLTFR